MIFDSFIKWVGFEFIGFGSDQFQIKLESNPSTHLDTLNDSLSSSSFFFYFAYVKLWHEVYECERPPHWLISPILLMIFWITNFLLFDPLGILGLLGISGMLLEHTFLFKRILFNYYFSWEMEMFDYQLLILNVLLCQGQSEVCHLLSTNFG